MIYRPYWPVTRLLQRFTKPRFTYFFASFITASVAWSQPMTPSVAPSNLSALTLEQLANITVTSVSKNPEESSKAAAAIYVITQEDIRRSGVTTIPEALRLAPGVEVARVQANQWSIGIRGFGSTITRSVLVLIDGRSVYNPLFAGTYWDVQDVVLDDIDRIEVIRGPGGSLWGANAVNGVINIITKSAKETQGGLASAGGGTQERGFGTVRYGGKMGDHVYYRGYGKYFDRESTFHPTGPDFDNWQQGQTGFRTDWDATTKDLITVQGDYYSGTAGEQATITTLSPPAMTTLTDDVHVAGGNVLSRWQRTFSETSGLSLQMYYDRTHRRDPQFLEDRHTGDIDFQNRFALPFQEDFTWGLEYRITADATSAVGALGFIPPDRTDRVYSAFVQDSIGLIPDYLVLTLGEKIEHNDYSGFESQPNGRLAWTPTDHQTVWGSISRAVRIPSQIEDGLTGEALLSAQTTTFLELVNTNNFKPEKLTAYELGYRIQPAQWISADVASFYNVYRDLLSVEIGTPFVDTSPPLTRTILPETVGNGLYGHTYGGELASTVQVCDWWRLRGTYSLLVMNLKTSTGSTDTTTVASTEGSSPRHNVSIESFYSLPHHVEVDPIVRYVDKLSALNIPSYVEMDLHVGWCPSTRWEVAVVGQNLLQMHHPEFTTLSDLDRGVYGKVTWKW